MTTGLADISEADIAVLQGTMPGAFGRPLTQRLRLVAGWVGGIGLIVFCLWRIDVAPQRLWQGFWKLG
jgi:hypothetical protein